MQNLKELLGTSESVWFEIEPSKQKRFLQWAKDLGCVWLNGKEINPCEKVEFFHFSIDKNGILGIVPAFAWANKNPKLKSIKRYTSDILK